jgi:hypothetical protein
MEGKAQQRGSRRHELDSTVEKLGLGLIIYNVVRPNNFPRL